MSGLRLSAMVQPRPPRLGRGWGCRLCRLSHAMLWRGFAPCDPTREARSKFWGGPLALTLVSLQEDAGMGPCSFGMCLPCWSRMD
eukprot:316074-Amphidinium_carterae.1